jgi:hypothetical protein
MDDTELSDVIDISKGHAISEKELFGILYDLPTVYNNDFTEWSMITYILKKKVSARFGMLGLNSHRDLINLKILNYKTHTMLVIN